MDLNTTMLSTPVVQPLEQTSKDQRDDGHELDEDVKTWAASVFQGISNCVSNHCSLVNVGPLSNHSTILIEQVATLDVFLSVIPSSTSVGG